MRHGPGVRLIIVASLCGFALWLAPGVAVAKRLADPQQKAAIVAALTSPNAQCFGSGSQRSCGPAISRGIPLRCTRVYVSTVDSAWGSESYLGGRSCLRWAANGIAIVHRIAGRWRFVTSGSAFLRCPIRAANGAGTVPNRVARDLTGAC